LASPPKVAVQVALACGTTPDDCGIHIAGTTDLGRKADHDLLTLPSPYLLETAVLQSSIRWETQRGCPSKCSFCQHREPGIRLKHQWFDGHRLIPAFVSAYLMS
jgi:hypothetical protein